MVHVGLPHAVEHEECESFFSVDDGIDFCSVFNEEFHEFEAELFVLKIVVFFFEA